ncbi:MAG: hypothetical protein FWG29_10820 [Treponema sp.]|nr:hypothetical protein [Treponema sp.]
MYYKPVFLGNSGIIKNILFILIPVLLIPACQLKNLSPEKTAGQAPLYIIKISGPEPYYFELDPNGPLLIPSPAEASLGPFIPWTHSRHISHFLPVYTNETGKEEVLYAAINRGGILELRNQGIENALYYHPGEEIWNDFQVAAFFRYNNKPTAFLTSERFFSVEERPSPPSPLWVLWEGSLKPITISAINADKSAAWISNSVFLGKDEIWYIKKSLSGQENNYFRTIDLSLSGQGIYVEQFLEAASPLEATSELVPPLLAWALAEAERLAGKPCNVTVVSPDFPAKRLFSGFTEVSDADQNTENGEFTLELSGYYRQNISGKEALAAILFPNGRGVYCRSNGIIIKDSHFTLPALHTTANPGIPSGNSEENTGSFVYTGVALLGNGPDIYLVAGWEEQKDWNVGAAGFLLVEINW